MKQQLKLIAFSTLLGLSFGECGSDSENHSSNLHITDSINMSTVQLPSNVLMLDTISTGEFNSWFGGGPPTRNGLVLPANSLNFSMVDTNTNVDFYKWSEQMFLWLTSPVEGSIVLESPTFYTVIDSSGSRILSQNTFGHPILMKTNLPQTDNHGLHFIVDKKGKRFEVEIGNEQNKDTVINASGKIVEVSQIKINNGKEAEFLNASGQVINHPRALITTKVKAGNIVHRFKAGEKFIFLDANGNQIDAEEGQAGGGNVLMSQNGSLVYYITMVNDVYAWYLTMFKDPTQHNVQQQFPTDTAGLNPVIRYAANHGVTLNDTNALAMELKTSWVKASTLPDSSGYVIITATIPTFTQTDSIWTASGYETTRMALVGIHVVGSVAGHPEMIWATFEHQSNAPNTAYDYINNNGNTDSVTADNTTGWLFSNGSSNQNAQLMTFNSGTPATITGTISPSNTLREAPWGCIRNLASNPIDTTAAKSNSEIISFNKSIGQLMPAGDIRANYLFTGATWTTGTAPNGNSYTINQPIAGAALGTSYLANSTMETAMQYSVAGEGGCFGCHQETLNPNTAFGLSHIFSDIIPLPVSPTTHYNKDKHQLKP